MTTANMIDWLFARYPNQPVRCALMVRILCSREIT
ncbi:UNVERIFIED_ORG: hypothetical protein ABIC54_004412 [Burkholderia sp. 1263]